MSFALAVTTLLALAIPFADQAAATHPPGATLEVLEEIDTNPAGTSHTLTAQLFAGTTNTPQAVGVLGLPVNVDFEVESGPAIRANCTALPNGTCAGGITEPTNEGNTPSTPDLTCDIQPGASSCVVTFTSDGGGTNIIRAFIDESRNNGGAAEPTYDGAEGRYAGPTDCGNRTTSPVGVGTGGRCDFDAVGGPLTAQPGSAEPDHTDVVEKTWTQTLAGTTCLDVDPNSDINPSGTEHQITATVTTAGNRTAANTSDPSSDACSSTGNPGTARANVQVEFSLNDADTGIAGSDDPNALFAFVNSVSTNPSGGGPNTVTCSTDNLGRCTVVIRTFAPTATGDNYVIGRVPGATGGTGGACNNVTFTGPTGGTGTGANNTCTAEVVRKIWASPTAVTEVDARPEEDTNVVGAVHSVSATASNALGTGVQGQTITFDVTGGVNATRDIDGNPSTPAGFFASCMTNAQGTCSASYSSALVGDDTITACIDANTDFNCTATEADSGPTTTGDANDDQVTKHWVAAGAGPTTIALDMEGCNGSLINPADASWDAAATPNAVTNDRNDAHPVCAAVFTSSNTQVRVPVTFTITGPGRFVVPSSQNNVPFVEGSNEDLGTSVTVEPGTCSQGATGPGNAGTNPTGTGTGSGSYNCAFLLSDTTGTTAVRACIEGSTTICDTGSKSWTTSVQNARTVAVTPETATNELGENHSFTVLVTDRFANPVAGVGVTWSRSGEGVIVSQETTTNSDGEAVVVITSDTPGTTTVTATIPAASTDCDEAGGAPADRPGTTAGNCTDSGTKTWTEEQEPQCSNGLDDDGDGRIDTADPGCADADDDSESPDPPRACQNRGTTENVIVGTPGPDVLNGTAGRDVICGAGGNDTINGRGGNDLIVGNGGDDTISGGGGKDNVSGNGGGDDVSGNGGNDAVKGNAGGDSLAGNAGIDTLTGGGGNDTLAGGRHEDILKGGGGNDILRGGKGDDALDGGSDRDRCFGNAGRDRIRNCE